MNSLNPYPVEITEDMSPQERHFALTEGNQFLRGLQNAGMFGSGGALAMLQRRPFPGNDPDAARLRALDYLASVATVIPPGLQSAIAARLGLLPTARAAAPAAGPLVKQGANAATLASQKARLSGLQMLLQQINRSVK